MNRDTTIDAAKGIGIILVVLGHTPGLPMILKEYIYSFHMPLFFLITGYLFNERKNKLVPYQGFFRLRFNRLIIPYFTMAFSCYFVFSLGLNTLGFLKNSEYDFLSTLKQLIGIIYSKGTLEWLPNCSPLWFLTCLFVTENILLFLLKRDMKKQIILAISMASLGYIISITIPFKLPWNIDTSLTAVLFTYFGYLLNKYNLVQIFYSKKKAQLVLITILSLFLLYLSNTFNFISYVSFNSNHYGNIFLMYIGAISGSATVFIISRFLHRSKILNFFGVNTMPIIGFNYAAIWFVGAVFSVLDLRYSWLLGFLSHLVVLIILILLIKKIPKYNSLVFGNSKTRIEIQNMKSGIIV
ncbi:acyltransferase [Bacillus sp. SLBN-46]|uniref:acyltransferase family protein n=1 Tax=Bacillus sp. SLBN-46 TaxID=3042283 RepID=UPI00285DBB25|nr:acyltransferase family protein [Bacillus sp. SLBN-46]MDR6121916.1 acyltransferase [Bacillus sp. SLBN-46]